MKKKLLAAAVAAALTLSLGGTVFAAEDKDIAMLKAEIDKLNAKVTQLEAKQTATAAKANSADAKAKINFFFDNRIEYTRSSLGPNDGGGWAGGNGKIDQKGQFMERIRMYMNAKVGDQWQWDSRFVQAKFNINNPADSSARFDRFWVTNNDLLGGKVEMGKMMLYPGKGSFYGNTGDTEGLFYTTKFDKLSMRIGNARNSGIAGQPGTDVSFVEATYRPTKKSDIGAYILKQDAMSGVKDMDLQVINGAMEIPNSNGLALSFEYAKNKAEGYQKSGYFVAIQSKYAATNYMPALYTSMVNPFKVKDHGWALSYRHMPRGVAGFMNRGGFSWVPLTTDDDGTWQNSFDDINAWRVDYVYVPWKNVQWTLSYDHIKPINGNWTNNSIQSTFNFFF